MAGVRQGLRSKKQDHKTTQKKQFQNSNANLRKLLEATLRNCEMSQKDEEKNIITDNHFIVEDARRRRCNDAKQSRNHVRNSFFIFINNFHERH